MPKILLSPRELATHLDDPAWIVFDTRHDLADPGKGRRAYEAGHIPGAHFLHLDEDLSGEKSGSNGRHPLPDPARFAKLLESHGVWPQSHVAVYDDTAGSYAVRLWWMLRWIGHEDVALLDGGFPAWQAAGLPVATEVSPPRAGRFTARPHLGWTVDAPFVERFHDDASIRLVDARAPERYSGAQETIDRAAGHVPGAINRFWKENVAPDGRFKARETLRAEFDELLAGKPPSHSVHMCGSGVTACHNLFAMELAGLPGARLYPGSWSEWSSDPKRPIATEK